MRQVVVVLSPTNSLLLNNNNNINILHQNPRAFQMLKTWMCNGDWDNFFFLFHIFLEKEDIYIHTSAHPQHLVTPDGIDVYYNY